LQRNQRNESRRSIASRIVTEISNYAGNNNGNLPVADVTTSAATSFGNPGLALGFFDRYMDCAPAPIVAPATMAGTCNTNINDPRTGLPVGTGNDGTTAADRIDTTVIAVGGAPHTKAGSIGYGTSQTCQGETSVVASNRNFVFMMRLEGGAVFCLDNK
jgi:hypothetical protein